MNPAALKALLAGDTVNAVLASTPGGIEAQEAVGQRDLVRINMLPKDIGKVPREKLEAIGFRFGDDLDDLFVSADLPAGWQKKATNHSMWSTIVDDKGRERFGVFYKAAFYDRRASMEPRTRFKVIPHADGSDKDHYRYVVTDGSVIVKEFGEWHINDYRKSDDLQRQASSWLAENYPNWRDPFAYWDEA